MRPESLGKYRLLRAIAVGGMGEVFLAEQAGPANFSKLVVIKRLLPHYAADREFVEMFLNEARLAALISHPNVVHVFDLAEERGQYFLAMELVHGVSLRAVLRRLTEKQDVFPSRIAGQICAEVLRGLHHAHQLVQNERPLNIVHRDVSPENVLIGFDGTVKLTDFGIAKALNSSRATRPGTVRGKLAYLAPEQLRGAPADRRMDIYAAGATLFESLSGRAPFVGETEGSVVHQILTASAQLPAQVVEASEELAAVALRALAKEPERRFATAEEMAQAIDGALDSSGDPVRPAQIAELVRGLFPDEASAGPMAQSPVPERRAPTQALPASNASPEAGPEENARAQGTTENVRYRRPLGWRVTGAAVAAIAVCAAALWLWPKPLPPVVAAPVIAPVATTLEPDAGPAPAEPESAPANPPDRGVVARKAKAKGKLQVFAKPWAEVFIGSRRLGLTPLPDPIELAPGTYVVRFRNAELRATRSVRISVRPGETAIARVNLLEP